MISARFCGRLNKDEFLPESIHDENPMQRSQRSTEALLSAQVYTIGRVLKLGLGFELGRMERSHRRFLAGAESHVHSEGVAESAPGHVSKSRQNPSRWMTAPSGDLERRNKATCRCSAYSVLDRWTVPQMPKYD